MSEMKHWFPVIIQQSNGSTKEVYESDFGKRVTTRHATDAIVTGICQKRQLAGTVILVGHLQRLSDGSSQYDPVARLTRVRRSSAYPDGWKREKV